MPQISRAAFPRTATIPPAGSTAILAGDSIGDIGPWNAVAPASGAGYGQWFTQLCAALSWSRLNQNMIPNGGFETDPATVAASGYNGYGYQAVNCALARVTGGANVTQNGSYSLKATVSAAGVFQVLLGATNSTNGLNGTNAGNGAANAVRFFFQPNTTYTVSAFAAMPAANGAGIAPRLVVAINAGAGYAYATSLQTVPRTSTMTRLTATFTTPATLVDTQIYLDGTGSCAVGDVVWLDNIQLEANGSVTAYSEYIYRGSISSSWLGNHGQAAGYAANLQDTAGNRITTNVATGGTWGANAVFVAAGINDIYAVGDPTHPVTPATWRTGMDTVLSYLTGLTPKPYIVVGGLSNSTRQPSPVPTSPFYANLEDCAAQIDGVTRQLCHRYGVLFVKARNAVPLQLVDVTTGAGVHPTADGMGYLATRYLAAMRTGR